MAHATDGGGSIRIPASLCGLFGLKPSRGRVSLAPIGETLAGAGAQHCVSISVRDSAALLDAMAGGEPGDPYRAPPSGSFLAATQRPPGRLRVAFMRKPVGDGPLDPVLVAAVERTAKMLEGLGHHVEEAAPDYDAAATGAAFGTVMCANTFTNIEVRAAGRVPGPDDLEPVTRLHAEIGQGISAHEYIRAVQTFHRTGRQLGRFFEKHDVLLSPTIARTHLPLGTVRMDGTLAQYQQGLAPMIPFTAVCNATGVPAMSVPLAWTDDGLPIGLHFVGRFGAEEMLFSLAAQLESAAPWRDRRPLGGNRMSKGMRTVVAGFIAGALSVLIFHQLGFWIANELGYARAPLYNLRPVPPWGVPTIVSMAFWGGLWGIGAACLVPRLPGALGGVLGWVLFGAIIVTLVNWFVVFPIKGVPMGGGFRMPGLVVVPLVYALWGFGMWLIARLLRAALGWR